MAKQVYTQSSASDRLKRTEAYAESVRKQFNATVNEILALKKSLPKLEDGVMYSFDGDTVAIRNKVASLLKRLHASTTMTIKKGIEAEWETANRECDDFIKQCFGQHLLESNMFRSWTNHNTNAMNAFANRSDAGMNLSDRVWNSCRQLRDEMEIAMTVGIGAGESASGMSRVVRKCLNDPDLMFRRFRYKKGEDANGNPIWGRKWKKRVIDPVTGKVMFIDYDKSSYIPKNAGLNSRGVYKSAYKNAMRVTRTETNMAYRRSDYIRWNQLSFVRGIHIELSNQHPDFDICDAMQGDYPKGFYFSGWHPHCFCYATPILVDEKEMKKVSDEFLKGKAYTPKGEMIRDTPPNFKNWIEENSKRLRQARSKPYWAKWNPSYVDAVKGEALTPEFKTRAEEIKEIAALRHAQRDDQAVLDKLQARRNLYAQNEKLASKAIADAQEYLMDVDISALEDLVTRRQYGQMGDVANNVLQQITEQKKLEKKYEKLIPDVHKFHQTYPISTIDAAYTAVGTRIGYFQNYSWAQQRQFLTMSIPNEQNPLVKAGLEKYLEKVKIEEKIELFTPQIDAYVKVSGKSTLKPYNDFALDAEKMLKARNVDEAERLLKLLDNMKDAADRYDELMSYYKTTPAGLGKAKQDSKVGIALKEAEALLKDGNVTDAIKKIEDGEKTRKINEASNAAKKAKAEKQKKDAEAIKKAEEAEKIKKKTHLECDSIDDFRELYGDDMPVILQNYEKSVQRESYCTAEFIKEKDEIEKKLKEFWKDVDFSHCTDPYALDGYFKNGVLTNLQLSGDSNSGYAGHRRSYGHFAFDLPGNNGGTGNVLKKFHLKPGEYYRCGVPCSKDPYVGFTRDNSGYGSAQIVFREDRIITTFTMGNSLGQRTIPSLTSDPKICSLDSKRVRHIGDKKFTIESLREGNGYCEVQYLPLKSQGNFTPRDIKRIVIRSHPENYHPEALWDQWAKEGVDIYYIDGSKAVLYKKGKPLMTQEEAKVKLEGIKDEVDNWLKNEPLLSNKDISFSDLSKYLKGQDYISALGEVERLKKTMLEIEKKYKDIEAYVPNARELNKKFSISELETAHEAIAKQITWLESKYPNRNDPEQLIGKFGRVMADLEKDKKYSTWEVARDALGRRRDELVYQYKKDSIEDTLKQIRSFKTKDKEFLERVKEIEDKTAKGKWYEVEDLLRKAKDEMISMQTVGLKKVLGLGESSLIRFSSEEFEEAKRNVAVWFKAQSNTSAAMKKAWKEADAYMSKYAQDMWKNLTVEERRVLWMYTDGSRYINEEMLGTYCFKMMSPWGDIRNGLTDANIITSVIEKSKALEESIWMQSAKSSDAFREMFGVDIRRVGDLSKLIGKEGSNNLFTSCHSASDGAFTKGTNTGAANDVILSIYMPKGTKGIYMEPFASWGDAKRGLSGAEWDGKKRKEAPSDQVEFLLQRGSKFKITKAYVGVDGKWHIDVDLIEQSAVSALNDKININNRSTRSPHFVAR